MSQVNQSNKIERVNKEEFKCVGIKWEGAFKQAAEGEIRKVHAEMQERLKEIKNVLNADVLLGLSYHASPNADGFVHYAMVEVETIEDVPAGMQSLTVPAYSYAKCEHQHGQSIDQSYNNMYQWIDDHGYQVSYNELTHFEKYPMSQNPYADDPVFSIMIPLLKKS